jgi:hypothetical protein
MVYRNGYALIRSAGGSLQIGVYHSRPFDCPIRTEFGEKRGPVQGRMQICCAKSRVPAKRTSHKNTAVLIGR